MRRLVAEPSLYLPDGMFSRNDPKFFYFWFDFSVVFERVMPFIQKAEFADKVTKKFTAAGVFSFFDYLFDNSR